MEIKGVLETFTDYKKTSLIILTSSCDFKCEKDGLCAKGSCQNSELTNSPTLKVSNKKIVNNYISNDLTKSCIIAGLEPFLQFKELKAFIGEFRKATQDDLIVFTGYYPDEIKNELLELKKFRNIIIKFGRFIENSKPKYCNLLGVNLASENQFSKRIEDL